MDPTTRLLDVKQEPDAKRIKVNNDESAKDDTDKPKEAADGTDKPKEEAKQAELQKLMGKLAASESNMANILTEQNLTPKEKKNVRKRFERSLEPCTQRQCRSQKVPPSIALKLVNMELKDKSQGRRYYFNLWLNSNEDWAKVEIAERVIRTKSIRKYGKSKWLMLHELEKLHPPIICKAIWDAKLADTSQWRPHPDVPEVQEAIQVKIPVEDGEEWDEQDKHSSETTLTAEVSKEAGKTLPPSRIGSNLGSPSASSLSPPAPPPAQARTSCSSSSTR